MWPALCGLAALSLAADVPHDAERLLRHARRQSEQRPARLPWIGPALLALGRIKEADAAARHLLKMEPENPQSWITIAAVSTRLMRQEEALEAYEQAARFKPDEVRLRMSIGHVQKTLGRRHESEASYKAALGLDPAMRKPTGAWRISRIIPSATAKSPPCSRCWRAIRARAPARRS